jgi:hypothetical protein
MKLTAAGAYACFPQLPRLSPSMADSMPHRHQISACAFLTVPLRRAMFIPPPAVYRRFAPSSEVDTTSLHDMLFQIVRSMLFKGSDGQQKRHRAGTKQVTVHEGTRLQSTLTHIGLIEWCRAPRGHICKLYIYIYTHTHIKYYTLNLGG